jgi:hypothetical protein
VLANRFDCRILLSLNQRHFHVVTDSSGMPFRLLPSDLD